MREVSGIAVDHAVIQSSRSYEAVKTALEQRLGVLGNTWMAVGYKTRVMGRDRPRDRAAARAMRFQYLR